VKPDAQVPTLEYNREHPILANPGETQIMAHLPQLDGVRAIAVLLVLWHHFAPGYANPGTLGAIGVGLFFVLSGFLITRILLNCRDKIDQGKSTAGQMLRQFYVRRFLRIFPLFYGSIAVLWAFDVTGFRERVWWHLAYFSNILFSIREFPRDANYPIERHFWSLAVEEQFYLFWPFIILFAPRKLIGWLIGLTILIGPVWRVVIQLNEVNLGLHKRSLLDQWATPGCLDLLGFGALLAIASLPQFGLARYWRPLIETAGIMGVPLIFIYITLAAVGALPFIPDQTPYLPTALAGVCLVGLAARGFSGPMGYLLQSAPMTYVGRISYGLYVIHMFVPHLMLHYFPSAGFGRDGGWWQFAVFSLVSVALATISWYAYEAPINRLKKYFEYDRKT
jgi:peptidoglycan/LPS O-acetylase OafA/YrhL